MLTGRDWLNGAAPSMDTGNLRQRSAITLALVACQVVLGAWLRHYGTNVALLMHALLAFAVLAHALALIVRVERRKREVPELVAPARWMALAVTLQVALGGLSWWVLRPFDGIPKYVGFYQAITRTGHQTNGALLLAASVVLTLRAYRHLKPQPRTESRTPLSLDLEAVT